MPKIYLMPFTPKSVLLYHALLGKGVAVAGFFDNDNAIHGKRYLDCSITNPVEPSETGKDLVILCEPRHCKANYAQINALGYRINELAEWLAYEDAKNFLSHIDNEAFERIVPRQMPALKRLPWTIQWFVLPEFIKAKDALVIDILELLVTEKCSLKCKKCANLMQYFTNPLNMGLEQVKRDIDLIFSKVDWIREFYIFGGEPFLYREFSQVAEYAMKYKKQFGLLGTITNGTIVPSDSTLRAIKENEMHVNISDYGEHSRRINELIEKLELHQISYQRMKVKWFDYQQLVSNEGRNAEAVFSKCKENCTTLKNGLLYRCPFLTHAETLRAIPYSEYNHIDLSRDDIKNRLSLTPPGCAYCSGYDVGNTPEVAIAEQAKSPLPYRKY